MAADAAAFHAVRLEGLTLHPREFRTGPEDWAIQPLDAVRERLVTDVVIGGFAADTLLGVAGLARETRDKLRHKALLWGMYVRPVARGTGMADQIVERVLDHARDAGVERVLLTVTAHNRPACRLYERWGFEPYGIEHRAVIVAGEYVDEVLMAKSLL
jgi:RimJ/RimL family protein N-acetyltransferase